MSNAFVCGLRACASCSHKFPSLLIFILTLLTLAGATATTTHASTINVPAGGDFQQALNVAQPGDEIVLQAGASYVGPFTLPYKANAGTGEQYIIIRTSALSTLPAAGQRITPADSALLPKLVSPGQGFPALRTAASAHHYRLVGIEFLSIAPDATVYELVILGNHGTNQDTLSEVPHHLTLDRCYIHAFPTQSLKRGIALNSAHTDIINSFISGFKVAGQEAQAILGWNGPGPFLIENNYLEAAGENVMFGGVDPSIPELVPSDIEFRRNYLTKPLSWRAGDVSYAGVTWTVKNIFELKNARRVLIEGNIFEHSWAEAQDGFAVVLSPVNQNGSAPWCAVEDVTITNNIIRHSASAIQIKLYSTPARRVTIRNNLFADIDGAKWCGANCSSGHFLQVETAVDLKVEHNTVLHSGNITSAAGVPTNGFVFTNNVIAQNQYGFHGNGRSPGSDSINFYFPNSIIRDNAIIGGDASQYRGRNMYPASWRQLKFVNPEGGDFRLRPDSPLKAKGTGGADIGADFEAIMRATSAN
jgi:hypothetical protein